MFSKFAAKVTNLSGGNIVLVDEIGPFVGIVLFLCSDRVYFAAKWRNSVGFGTKYELE
jgi:hypothetical protein